MGFARSDEAFEVVCRDFVSTRTPTLRVCLQPNQVAALETLRDAGDLTFDLLFAGTATDHHGNQHVNGDCPIRVPRSEWLETLRGAGVRNVMLLEVPLPFEGVSEDWREVASNLQRAEEEYGNGNYRGCIASCRIAIDELGKLRDIKWRSALSRLAEDQARGMSKSQREEGLYAVSCGTTRIRHTTRRATAVLPSTRAPKRSSS